MGKKDIFGRPSADSIRKGRKQVVARKNIVERLLDINPETQYLIIDRRLIPDDFYRMSRKVLTRTEANRKFMKHGEEIRFRRFRSIDKAIEGMQEKNKIPLQIRKELYEAAEPGFWCAYSFIPIIGNDKRKRKVALTEVLEGAKLYAYAERDGRKIQVRTYADAKRVAIDGGIADIILPSRSPKRQSYEFSLMGIPVTDDSHKYVLANTVISDHSCPDMRHRGKRFRFADDKENSRVFNWCAHDIAAWYAVVDHYWNREHNVVPLQMSQIPLPSRLMADLYQRLTASTLIWTRESPENKANLYPLNNAELEILLQNASIKLGHDETLFCDKRRDGDLRDYAWRGLD
jgi:hypothetical protein